MASAKKTERSSREQPSDLRPSDLELQILNILWQAGPATVREVLEKIPDQKKRAYTSVLSVMQVMQKKGLLKSRRTEEGLAYLYEPTVKQREVMRPVVRGWIHRLFGGSPQAAVQQILSEHEINAEEIAELKAFLDTLSHSKKRKN